MPNNNNTFPANESPSAVYGIRRGFNISDFPGSETTDYVAAFTNASANTVSSPITSTGRYLEVLVAFSSAATAAGTTCNIDIYSYANSTATLLLSTPVTASNPHFYAGNYEGVDLGSVGQFEIGISNIQNAANITVNYRTKN